MTAVNTKTQTFSELSGLEIASLIRLMASESDEILSFDDLEDDFLNNSIICQAYLDTELVGYAMLGKRTSTVTTAETTGYISNILVAQKHRGKGIGTKLLSTCLDISPRMFLYVGADNKSAISLYRKHGFTQEVFLPYFYQEWEPNSVKERRGQAIYADAYLMSTFPRGTDITPATYGSPLRRS